MQKKVLPVRPSNVPLIEIVDGKFVFEIGSTRRIPLDRIVPNPHQPRKYFDPSELRATAESYKHRGDVEKPLDVCIRTTSEGADYAFIIDGESRFRAGKLPIAGLESISCYIKEDLGDDEIYLSSAVANIRRRDFSVIEQALTIFDLQMRFDLDQNAAGKLLGYEPSSVSYLMSFLDLHEKVQMLVMEKRLGVGVARQLAKFKVDEQLRYLKKIAEAIKENGGKPIHPNKVARILRGEMERKGAKPVQTGRGRNHSSHGQLVARHLLSSIERFEDALKEFNGLSPKVVKELTDPHFLDIEKGLQTATEHISEQLKRLAQHA